MWAWRLPFPLLGRSLRPHAATELRPSPSEVDGCAAHATTGIRHAPRTRWINIPRNVGMIHFFHTDRVRRSTLALVLVIADTCPVATRLQPIGDSPWRSR